MQHKEHTTLPARRAYDETGPRTPEYRRRHIADTHVAIIGLGYVGLPLAIAAAESGLTVTGFDTDTEKIKRLTQRDVDYLSPEEHDTFMKVDIELLSDFEGLREADTYIICVPTPVSDEYLPDLTPLIEASRTVAAALTRGKLVVVESSVSPGICEEIVIPVLEFESDLSVEKDFSFVYCPERVNPGDERYNTKNIPRVIGGAGAVSLERGIELYDHILDAPLRPMETLKEAEAVKMVENSFRDVNIAFANELAMAFDKEGIDVVNVIEAASTKPFGFLPHYPGCGVGGHCIPVDPYYLIHNGLEHGFAHRLLITAREVNNYMPHYTLKTLYEALQQHGRLLATTPITILGLAYKRGISDTRESPAMEMFKELLTAGVPVEAYDPFVPALSTADDLDTALRGARAVIIATDHDEFLHLTPQDFAERGVEIVIDGRNALEKTEFLHSPVSYYGIGRG